MCSINVKLDGSPSTTGAVKRELHLHIEISRGCILELLYWPKRKVQIYLKGELCHYTQIAE